MYVCLGVLELVFQEKRFKCVRKEQIVPLETRISWEISYKLLRLCLLIARIFQGTGEKSASGPAVGSTGSMIHMSGGVCPSGIPALGAGGLHVPKSGGPGWLPDSCFAEKQNTGESEAHQEKGGLALSWLGWAL